MDRDCRTVVLPYLSSSYFFLSIAKADLKWLCVRVHWQITLRFHLWNSTLHAITIREDLNEIYCLFYPYRTFDFGAVLSFLQSRNWSYWTWTWPFWLGINKNVPRQFWVKIFYFEHVLQSSTYKWYTQNVIIVLTAFQQLLNFQKTMTIFLKSARTHFQNMKIIEWFLNEIQAKHWCIIEWEFIIAQYDLAVVHPKAIRFVWNFVRRIIKYTSMSSLIYF